MEYEIDVGDTADSQPGATMQLYLAECLRDMQPAAPSSQPKSWAQLFSDEPNSGPHPEAIDRCITQAAAAFSRFASKREAHQKGKLIRLYFMGIERGPIGLLKTFLREGLNYVGVDISEILCLEGEAKNCIADMTRC